MASMGAQEIFDNFHKNATGSQGLSTAGVTAQKLAAKYQERAIDIQKLIDGVRSGWTGDAAEEASQGLMPLADNSLATHQQLSTGQEIVSRQLSSFHTAVAEVQPVPPEPSMQNVITAVMTGQDPQSMLGRIVAHNAVSQSNVDAYSKYVSASRYNTTNLPPLEAMTASPGAPVAAVVPPGSQTSGTVVHPSPDSRTSGTASRSGTASTSGAATSSHAGTTVSSVLDQPTGASQAPQTGSFAAPGPGGSGADRTAISSVAPSAGTALPAGVSSATIGVGSAPAPAGGQGNAAGSGGLGSQPGLGEPSPDGVTADIGSRLRGTGGPVGEGAPGAAGVRRGPDVPDGKRSGSVARTGSGAALPREGVGATAGPRGAVVGAPGEAEDEGPRSGAGNGVAAEEELAAERGLASTRDGAPGTGASPIGASRSGGGDTRHQRKYEYGDDPDELFGTDRKVAQPVLGETAEQRAARDVQERQ
jgi:hypothetical protein